MPDQDQNRTAKSFSGVWVFPWLQTLAQVSGALLQNTLQIVSSRHYSVLHIILLQSERVSHAHQIGERQEVTQSGVLFCLYAACPFSW